MYMWDDLSMHQINLGVITSFLKAILRKYLECVKTHLNIAGRAAKKPTERLQRMLKKTITESGHTMSGKNDCLVPINYGTTLVFIFMHPFCKNKTSRHCRATDYRHIFMLLPFILHKLFRDEVNEFNHRRPDPSHWPIFKVCDRCKKTFLSWYKLLCRITPSKTPADIATLQNRSHRYIFNWLFWIFWSFLLFVCFLLFWLFQLFSLFQFFVLFCFLRSLPNMFEIVSPDKNKLGRLIIDTEKAHSI